MSLAHVHTPDIWAFEYAWTSALDRSYLTFQIRACHDAQLALATLPTVADVLAYQVIIGGWINTKSAIRHRLSYGTGLDAEVETVGILDCQEARGFWVGWAAQRIAVGYGNIPFEAEFLSYTDTEYRLVTSVGLSTGHGSDGDWFIDTQER